MGMTFNGKPFDPKDFTESLMKSLMEKAAEQIREKVCAIRHPETGEFPTVVFSGTSLENMSYKIEGSPELLALVHERLDLTTVDTSAPKAKIPYVVSSPPIAFMSYAWEDRELAGQIAHLLQGRGVETWWAEWCLKAGDSLRQKIDEGLGTCTHFIVLLTPNSLTKPWVNQEMDAGLMLKLQSKVTFIPLRHQLEVKELPPLLQGMLSPVVTDSDKDVAQLVNDIYGVTKKPVLARHLRLWQKSKPPPILGFRPQPTLSPKCLLRELSTRGNLIRGLKSMTSWLQLGSQTKMSKMPCMSCTEWCMPITMAKFTRRPSYS